MFPSNYVYTLAVSNTPTLLGSQTNDFSQTFLKRKWKGDIYMLFFSQLIVTLACELFVMFVKVIQSRWQNSEGLTIKLLQLQNNDQQQLRPWWAPYVWERQRKWWTHASYTFASFSTKLFPSNAPQLLNKTSKNHVKQLYELWWESGEVYLHLFLSVMGVYMHIYPALSKPCEIVVCHVSAVALGDKIAQTSHIKQKKHTNGYFLHICKQWSIFSRNFPKASLLVT